MTVLRTLRLDVKATEVISALAADHVPSILLKGHAFASLLYRDGAVRDYVDIDLLVPEGHLTACVRSLRRQGFRPFLLREDDALNPQEHADSWRRPADGVDVDLHVTLPEVTGPGVLTWEILSAHTVPLVVAGSTVAVLDRPASALLAALHRAHHDEDHVSPSDDLERAIRDLDVEDWLVASDLAGRLGASAPFRAGIARVAGGDELRARLSLFETDDERRFAERHAMSREERVLAELRERPLFRRVQLASSILFAHPRTLRIRYPLARRGPLGLLAAYAIRPFDLIRRLVATLRSSRRP